MTNTGAPLVENFMERCTVLDRTRDQDGFGGSTVVYKDGLSFMAAIVKDKSLNARVAEKDGMTAVYTITTPSGVGLDFHEVFRRESDGTTFRVTSDHADSKPPKMASFAFEQVTAERWVLPT